MWFVIITVEISFIIFFYYAMFFFFSNRKFNFLTITWKLLHDMLLIPCKFKCYIHHFIIYAILNNVLNFCNFVCSLYVITYKTHILILLDPRKHSSPDFNNAKDIFACIQFVTIDWCNSRCSAIFFARLL